MAPAVRRTRKAAGREAAAGPDRADLAAGAAGRNSGHSSGRAGSIEITLSGGVRVKVTGAVDPVAITAAVGAVMKARRRR